jgi:serine O-acetyltransferase
MFDAIIEDFARYRGECDSSGFLGACKILMLSFGFQTMLIYRWGRWSEKQVAPLRYVLLPAYYVGESLVRVLYGIHIKRCATIEPGLYLGHFGGIVIGHCSIGSNSVVSHRVVIEGDSKGVPSIGQSVWIGPHARIIGPVQIGDGATVGAGAVVVNDVPSRCLVMGNPARIINRDYDNSPILP